MKSLKSVSSDDLDLSRLQSYLKVWAQSVALQGLNNGVLVEKAALNSAGITLVDHKLGREPKGWILVRKRGPGDIWDSQDDNVFKSKSLALECSANVVVDLWIY